MITRIVLKIKRIYLRVQKMFYSPEEWAKHIGVKVGTNNFYGNDKEHWSSEPYLVTIGSNCSITNGVKIFTHGGGRAVRFMDPTFDCFGKVTIGDYVYIGTNTLIMPGVSIGNNVLIAAGSVVTKSIPANVVVGGNPASVICSIEEFYERNKQYNLGTKNLSESEKRKVLLATDEQKFIKKRLITI